MRIFFYIVAGVIVLVLGLGTIAYQMPVATSKIVWPLIEDRMLAEPFIGITNDGSVKPDLFRIRSTGVSTALVVAAAEAFTETMDEQKRNKLMYAVDDDEWRRWANIHISTRQGVGLAEMNDDQSEAAFNLLQASLSARGLDTSRKIMKLEGHLADLMDDHNQYGSQRYWFTIMGKPSQTEPWGWQLDGHHLIINYFVLGDQVVMSPVFMGAEPVRALTGPDAGTEILQEEQAAGLALIRSLSEDQRDIAITATAKPGNNNYGELFQDNAVVPVEGIKLDALDETQRAIAIELISLYVNNLKRGQAEIHLTDIVQHWSETYFSWVGGIGDDSVFYYRIMSPVIMIEFDHQSPVALEGSAPSRVHVHTVVRTPNGNDYGKDLLRQHLAKHPH